MVHKFWYQSSFRVTQAPFLLLAYMLWIFVPSVHAGGFRLIDQDPYATARGNAFVASANRASAVYYNPAGITQIEQPEVHLGYHLVHLDANYKSPDGSRYVSNRSEFLGPPQFYAVMPIEDSPLTLGFGLYSPFGLGLEWPDDSGFRTLIKKAELVYLTAAPTAALQLSDSLSLGASLNINYADLELVQGLTPDPASGSLALNTDGVALGFTVGARWQPSETLSFGVRYLSPSYVDLDGEVSLNGEKGDAEARFAFPDSIAAGIAYSPSERWTVELQYDWTNWDRLDTVTFETSTLGPLPSVLNYSASSVAGIGVTYETDSKWELSTGYYYSENSVPNKEFNPAVPDLDKHYIGAGVSRDFGGIIATIAYQYAFSGTRVVAGSTPSMTGESADGSYRVDIHALALGIQFAF